MGMSETLRLRWWAKDAEHAEWRHLPGEFTPQEILEMRIRGEMWIAIPVRAHLRLEDLCGQS